MTAKIQLTEADLRHLLGLVRQHWPEILECDIRLTNVALNRIQALAESCGLSAVTPASIGGIREIFEEYFLPVVTIELARGEAAKPANPHPGHLGRANGGTP